MKNVLNYIYDGAMANSFIDCPDGSRADASLGCIEAPSSIVNRSTGVNELLISSAEIFLWGVIILSTMGLIYSGIQYSLAQGDELKTQKAKRSFLVGLIGLSLAVLARSGVGFLLGFI